MNGEPMHHQTGTSAWSHRALIAGLGLTTVLALAACPEVTPPIALTGTGDIEGLVFFDKSEDGLFDPADGDSAVSGVALVIQERASGQTFAGGTATTGVDGRFALTGIPAGTHDMLIDTLTVPSGMTICENPLLVTVFIDETTFSDVNGRPGCLITILEAKDADIPSFVIVRGIVTSKPDQIEPGASYIEDATGGGIFLDGLNDPSINVGDQIEVGGTTALPFGDRFELQGVTLRVLVPNVMTPVPVTVTTDEIAATGPDPFHDLQNRFIRVENAELIGAMGTAGSTQNGTIDDGSGSVTMRVGVNVTPRADLTTVYTVGTCYDINGFPSLFMGQAQIFPRSTADIVEVTCN